MATARTEELLALARRIDDALPQQVADEILLTGSTSRGEADEISDIELLLVAEELPPLSEAATAARAAGLQVFDEGALPTGEAWWLGASFEDAFLELIAWSSARAEERIGGILAGEMVDHARIRTAEAVAHGLALRTSGAIAGWKERLRRYPDGLTETIVRDAVVGWAEPPQAARSHLRPGGRLALVQMLAEDAQNVLRIVFALNRTWEPSWKRLPQLVEPLDVKPEQLAERIDAALVEADPSRALRLTRELVWDALALAPDLPGVVLARAQTAALLEELE